MTLVSHRTHGGAVGKLGFRAAITEPSSAHLRRACYAKGFTAVLAAAGGADMRTNMRR